MPKIAAVMDEKETTWFSSPETNHAVHFYPFDGALLSSLVEYFRTGLKRGDTCIAVATPNHLMSLNTALRADGIDVLEAIENGQYVVFDDASTLSKFMTNGLPDYQQFLKSVGRIISLASGRGKPIRAFGEMVAILWEEGNLEGVIKLEEYWHDLVKEHSFSLYCAYPDARFNKSSRHKEAMNRICGCHSQAISTAPSFA